MGQEMVIKVTVSDTKRSKSWRDLKKFEDDFGDYCTFMGYCPLIQFQPIDGGTSLKVSLKGGKGVGIEHSSTQNFVKDLEKAFPNYNFTALI